MPHVITNRLRQVADFHNRALTGVRLEGWKSIGLDDVADGDCREGRVGLLSSDFKVQAGNGVGNDIGHNGWILQSLANSPIER